MNITDPPYIYRILPIENLENDLKNGFFAKNNIPNDDSRVVMANSDVIQLRDKMVVKCFKGTFVNDYVPFYFSVRTPMLYNIITGKGVIQRRQNEISYLRFRIDALAIRDFQWCYTDGNAAMNISSFYSNLKDLNKLDWRSILTEDFRYDNADGDTDRIRKKHSEFLVKDYVPASKINSIVVFNIVAKRKVDKILKNCNFVVNVEINPNEKYYF